MTAQPEENPNQDLSGVGPSAGHDLNPQRPVTAEDLTAAIPLLLSVKTPHGLSGPGVLVDAEAAGAHVVHRQLSSIGDRHYYKVVCDQPSDLKFRTYFVQPSTNPGESVRLLRAIQKHDNSVATSPNTGSSVAHGDFGPNTFHLTADGPTYYFVVGLPVGNQLANAPYTLVVLEV